MTASPDVLREFRGTYSVAYRELLRVIALSECPAVGVLEGKDAPYYFPRVESWFAAKAIDPKLRFVAAKGRLNVLRVRNAADANDSLNRNPVFYVIDRDFTDGLEAREDTYVTPGYSVESFFSSWEFVEKIITYEILQGESSEDIDRAIFILKRKYEISSQEFLSKSDYFNNWVFAQRHKSSKRVKLSAYDKKSFCKIIKDEDELRVEVIDFDPSTLGDHDSHPDAAAINEARLKRDRNCIQSIRGKQAIIFIANFLDYASIFLREELGHLDIEIRYNDVGVKNIIPRFSQYADTSRCLRDFLDLWWDRHWGRN